MARNYELENALEKVKADAVRTVEYYRKQLTEKPLSGWSQEKHEQYCNEQIERALVVDKWCFTRLMQHNPD
jgi:hypothetical protein